VTLEAIRVFEIPKTIVVQTEESLQEAGTAGYELFVLWSGVVSRNVFHVRTAHVPKQTSFQTPEGLLVRVEGPALHALNVWLFENGETLGAQIHAHPTEAFHSRTDDAYPIMTVLGGLSIVAADFASRGLLNRHSAAYRLSRRGWDAIARPHKSSLIGVVN
jgi:hypothetical protein